MKKIITNLVCFLAFSTIIHAQMLVETDTLYGNEWINFDLAHYKIKLAEDGIYRVTSQNLVDQGIPASSIAGEDFRLFYMGKEIPIYTSTAGDFGANAYLEFYGQKNRTALDAYLYNNPEAEMLNPEYSLFTDTSAYFLTWETGSSGNNRFENLTNDITNPPAAESSCWSESLSVFKDKHIKKNINNEDFKSYFEIAEGFCTGFSTNALSFTLTTAQAITNSGSGNMTVRWAGGSGIHRHEVKLNGVVVAEEDWTGYGVKEAAFSVGAGALNAALIVDVNGDPSDSFDKPAVAFIKLEYPRSFNFSNKNSFEFYVDGGSSSRFLSISNFDVSGGSPVLYDLTNHLRIACTVESGLVKVLLPASTQKRKLILVNDGTGAFSVPEMRNAAFVDYGSLPSEYIMISNRQLYGSVTDWVEEYRVYRTTETGGGMDAKIYDVQQIYDQFAYGINRHCISIRNFTNYAARYWDNPRYLFLMGKGIEYEQIRTVDNIDDVPFFVPTFGTPGADNLFGTPNDGKYSVMPIGRLSAINSNHVRMYLDKVIDHENNFAASQTIEDRAWMKRMIHLGGGKVNEQPLIKTQLDAFENIIATNRYGGQVTSFYKNSADPIQISQSDQLKGLINDGVSLITFFGHSSAGNFDFNLDNPSTYENEGKYPAIVSLGCYSGQIHNNDVQGISENFVLQEKKAAIAFFASTGAGYISQLSEFGKYFYSNLGSETTYGEGLGDIMQRAFFESGYSMGQLPHQMTLHGDPAIRLNPHPGPDYIVDPATVLTEPSQINIRQDSFHFEFEIVNIGSYVDDTITLEVKQRFPDGDEELVVSEQIKAPAFREKLRYAIPSFGSVALGANSFTINIDYNDDVEELPGLAEMNNEQIFAPVYFVSNDLNPVLPPEYSIVNEEGVVLKASTTDAFIASQSYVFEIDTTSLFNSAVKQRYVTESGGGVVSWKPDMNYENSRVYYWRVSPDSTSADVGYIWKKSSFIYLPTSSAGWNQSHYYQFQDDYYANIELSPSRKFDFIEDVKDVLGFNPTNGGVNRTKWSINGQRQDKYRLTPDAGVLIGLLDSVYVEAILNPPGGPFNNTTASGRKFFMFRTKEAQDRKKLMDFLTDSIEQSTYVLFMNVMKAGFSYEPEEWASDTDLYGQNIFDILEGQGAAVARSFETDGSYPYIFLYQKDKGLLGEKRAYDYEELLELSYSITGNWDRGYIDSPNIGPAQSWESLTWDYTAADNLETDLVSVDVYGVQKTGEVDLLHTVTGQDTSLAHIDAGIYPYLKLRYNAKDLVWLSCPQLDFWRINYQGIPEVALNPNIAYEFRKDNVRQGEDIYLKVAIDNIGQYDMDSLLVKYTVTDVENNEVASYERNAPLVVGDNYTTDFSFNTKDLRGQNRLVVEVNPDEDQGELYHFNNVGVKEFTVVQDERNPLLDVTFDGVHIMDGDIVSARPEVLISLKDENEFLMLNDTSLFNVFVQYPEENTIRPVYIDNDILTFFPGDENSGNKAQLFYRPTFAKDGVYTLIVQAEDRSGNQSGSLDYKIRFEVITESSISNVLNYPNPFSTATKFVFTLTGHEVPERMKIQVMTVSGKVVREISKEELGPLHIGNNITDFSWDGTDEYGDRLANGVYLYRVVTQKADGTSYDSFQTGADKYFKAGMGKMVLLR